MSDGTKEGTFNAACGTCGGSVPLRIQPKVTGEVKLWVGGCLDCGKKHRADMRSLKEEIERLKQNNN